MVGGDPELVQVRVEDELEDPVTMFVVELDTMAGGAVGINRKNVHHTPQ